MGYVIKAVLGIRDILVRIRIRTSGYRIRIQLRIRLLSSVTLGMKKKIIFFLTHRHIIFSLENLIFG